MRKIRLIRRKSLLEAGATDSRLIELHKRNPYFKSRPGEKSLFGPFDALLVFIAHDLWDFMPIGNVSAALDDIVKYRRNLYGRLKQNPKQYLVVELRTEEPVPDIEISRYVTYAVLADIFKSEAWKWDEHRVVVLVNLENVYRKVEDLFERAGILVGHVSWEE